MLAKVISCAIVGLDAELVEVEVDVVKGYPAFAMVGLPDAAVRESRDRVYSAIPMMTHDDESFSQDGAVYAADFADIMGQEHVKRAMEIAAAGGHNALMFGTKIGSIFAEGADGVAAYDDPRKSDHKLKWIAL